jgi:tetratricopeptide (TPR) repeat protein
MKGLPEFDFQRIVFDGSIPDERFQYKPAKNATIVDAGDGHALLEHANEMVASARYAEAIPLTQEIIAKYPKWWGASEARMLLGCCYINTGEPAKALEPLEQGFAERDGFVGDTGEYFLGVAYERLGRPEDALRAYIRASLQVLEEGRTGMFPDPDAREAIIRLQDSLFRDSIPDWANVIDLRADRVCLSVWAEADALRKDRQFQQALDTYQRAIATLSQNYYRRRCVGPLMMGLCYEGLGLTQEAMEQCRKCIANHGVMVGPDNWAVRQAA